MASQLTPADRLRLIEKIAPQIETEQSESRSKGWKSLWGLCSDLGPAPSAEDMDKIRGEEWISFPRGDI